MMGRPGQQLEQWFVEGQLWRQLGWQVVGQQGWPRQVWGQLREVVGWLWQQLAQ